VGFPKVVVANKVTPSLVRIALGVLFIYASADKILYPEQFAEAVQNYQVLPLPLVNLFALALPWVELIAGVCLLNGFRTHSSNMVVFLLTCMFTVGVVSAMARGIDIHCGCFSMEGGRKVGGKMLGEEGLLLLMCAIVFFFDRGWFSVDGLLSKREQGMERCREMRGT
jgi:putative oxidoreductase